MDLTAMISELKAHFQTAEAEAERFLADHLPALASVADKAATNPVVTAILRAEHLSPEFLTALASVIDTTEAHLAAAEAAKVAAETAAANAAVPPAGEAGASAPAA